MDVLVSAVRALHVLFAGLWAGSVVFVTLGVLPTARAGDINAEPLGTIIGRLQTISRISAVLLLLTGGHMAGMAYTSSSLTGTLGGQLVLAMVVLWLALMGLTEVGAGRLADGVDQHKVRSPARDNQRLFQVASLVAVLLLVIGGTLTTI